MKYESGARVQDLRIVIRQSRQYVESGIPMTEPGIIIQFVNGEFDSEKWQEDTGQSDEVRELVEKKIERSRYFGQIDNPRGFWHMTQKSRREDAPAAEPSEPAAKCSHTEIVEGESVPCPNDAIPGTTTCDDHILETV